MNGRPAIVRSLVYVVNELQWFWTHRLPLAQAARQRGWNVRVISPPSEFVARVEAAGFPVEPILPGRGENSVIAAIRNVAVLVGAYRRLHPELVHHVTIKPVLYGSIAARIARVPAVVNAIAGVGYAFTAPGVKGRVLRGAVVRGLRKALEGDARCVIFQNPDDRRVFVRLGIVDESATALIRGAGVDTAKFRPTPLPDGVPIALLPARMLWDKGIGELVSAARLLRERRIPGRIVLCGGPDPANPTSITELQLRRWVNEGLVEWWGERSDMEAVIEQAMIVVLPSYREGLPKALLEAAAGGRPIITTDVPGCREVVRDGVNGLLVPPRDATRLADALAALLVDRALCERMGSAGRTIAVAEFSQEQVVQETLGVYDGVHSAHRAEADSIVHAVP